MTEGPASTAPGAGQGPRAVLDACVLFPTALRDLLTGCAAEGLFRPLFSERILREWVLATAKLGPGAPLVAEAEAALLRARFAQGMVREHPEIEARLHLPDANDLHVLAVAIAGHADCIITFNAQDFPRGALAEEGLQRRDPDGFLWELQSHHPETLARVAEAARARASQLSGRDITLKALLKKARLHRLAKAMAA